MTIGEYRQTMTSFFKDLAVAMTEKVRSIVENEVRNGLRTVGASRETGIENSSETPNRYCIEFETISICNFVKLLFGVSIVNCLKRQFL